MLIQFTFGNFRSFKAEATLSLVAASKLQADPALDAGNVFQARERPRLDLLRVAALYGANASGKSNVALALNWFQRYVEELANIGFHPRLQPFLFDTTSHDKPTFFEITFLQGATQYRYGFEIKQGDKYVVIVSEWLYQAEKTTETMLFEREGTTVRHGRRFTEGKVLLTNGKLNRADALFLSLAAQLGTKIAFDLVVTSRFNLTILQGISDKRLHDFTRLCLDQNRYTDAIQTLIREADTGIPRIALVDDTIMEDNLVSDGMEESIDEWFILSESRHVLAQHPVFNEAGEQVDVAQFPLLINESQGTQKLFAYAGPILDTLERGSTLIIDEMDARFHPLLTRALVRLFQSSETNPKNAQLVFITHDTNLLDSKNLRRDQIWFVEKDRFGASHLYALSDFKGVRKDASFEEEYIQGRYGAIPFLGGLNKLFKTEEATPENTPAGDGHATT